MYIMTNAAWGDEVEVTVEDVKRQAEIFGIDPAEIVEKWGGIYRIDADQNRELIAEEK